MKQVFVFGVFVALSLFLGQIRADTGTVFVQGTASGRLGDNPFMDVQIVFTGTYDTGDITETDRGQSRRWTAPIYATIDVPGIGQAEIQEGQVISFSQNEPVHLPPSVLGMCFPYFIVEGGHFDYNLNYDLTYTFGPVRLGFNPPPPIGQPSYGVGTSAGPLVITGQDFYDWTFYVEVVPE